MAIPRTTLPAQPVKLPWTLTDDTGYAAGLAALQAMKERDAELFAEIEAASNLQSMPANHGDDEAAAAALLRGDPLPELADDPVVDVNALKSERSKLAREMDRQRRVLQIAKVSLAKRAADELSTEDNRDARDLLTAMQQVLAIRQRRILRRSAFAAGFDGCTLPELDITGQLASAIKAGADQFAASIAMLGG